MTTKTAMTEEEELAILFPQPRPLRAGNLTILVSPMNTKDCAHFSAKARPIIQAALATGNSFGTDPDGLANVLGAVIAAAADYPNELIEALAIATGRSAEFIGKLPPAVTANLARLVFEVNVDFFVHGAGLVASGVQAIAPAAASSAGAGQTH